MNGHEKYRNVTATLAGLLWGGYAFTVNCNHLPSALKSGIFQALASFITTFTSVQLLVSIQSCFKRQLSKVIIPPVILLVLTSLLYFFIHSFIKTENILLTLLPNLAAGFAFSTITCLHLNPTSYQGQSNELR